MIKKGRKPKGKHNKLQIDPDILLNLEKRKICNIRLNMKNNQSADSVCDNSENMKMDFNNDVENTNSIITSDYHTKRGNDKGDRTPEKMLFEISGPITRRKENLIINISNSKGNNEDIPNLNSLKNYDEFYKDVKNIDNEMYQYRPPRVSFSYQVDLTLSIYSENEKIKSKYDFSKITKEDLNYYLKFVNYYKDSLEGNNLLKGVSHFETNALDLLKECNYDINLTLRKILFPCIDMENIGNTKKSKEEIMIYVNSALNDLIGSNIHEKEKWLEYVKERINNKINIDELQVLIELANKMKIEIPEFVIIEIEKSLKFSQIVSLHLNDKNSIKDIQRLVDESMNYKVKTEETYILQDIINKANNWVCKASEIEDICVNYKSLQMLYNEGKNLPVKLSNFDKIKNRYLKAQAWQEKFISLPKHSKTRQTNSQQERCTISYLSDLISEADEINYTSNEVISIKSNFNKLKEAESRIMMSLEDNLKPRTKEVLNEYIHILDTLKFTTDLYESISNNIEYLNWNEKKEYYMSNKILKIKHLRNLIKDANQKNLNNILEIKNFKTNCEKIEKWLDNMSNIFYKEENHIDKNKIDIKDITSYYETGKEFEIRLEEVEHLLIKCEEIFDFVKECKAANNSQTYDFQKLFKLREQIQKYNIKCEEFDIIDKQINLVQSWMEIYEDITNKMKETRECKFIFRELSSLEIRQELVEMLEHFLRKNQCFMENLNDVLNRVPPFAKCSKEYMELLHENQIAERVMNNCNPDIMELDELQLFINETHSLYVKKSFFAQLLCLYRAKSWSYIASLKKKMSLSEADSLLKEAHNLNLDSNEVESIKTQINKTKDWIKQWKKISNIEKINYIDLKEFINEGSVLPLRTDELEELFIFQASLENDIFQARSFLQNKSDYEELNEFISRIKQFSIIVPEFEIIFELKNLCDDWKAIVDKILASRKLCLLYFKKDMNNLPIYNKFDESFKLVSEDNDDIFKKGSYTNSVSEDIITYKKQKLDDNCSLSKINSTTNEIFNKMGNLENANINIINNNFYFNNSSPDNIKSKKKIKKTSKKDYENVLNIINMIPPKKDDSSPKKKFNCEVINLKKFNSFTYEEKLDIISKTVMLKKENEDECYCICRRGDDSVNYMIMCENCKEWFHGKCLKISKNTADKISQYLCLACSKRKDTYNHSYHNDFLNYKRISIDKFLVIIEEGKRLNISMHEVDLLNTHLNKVNDWIDKYNQLYKDILCFIEKETTKYKIVIFDEKIEKKIIDLYLESEGFVIDIEYSFNLIMILKHHDWFKDACKCYENRKFSEKINKKVLSLYHTIFNNDNFSTRTEVEKLYFEKLNKKAKDLYIEIYSMYEKYFSCLNIYKREEKKKISEEEKSKNEIYDDLLIEVDNYNVWKSTLFDNFNDNISEEEFTELVNISKSFKLQTSFLEKFRNILKNFRKENIPLYRHTLFEDMNFNTTIESKQLNAINKFKKNK